MLILLEPSRVGEQHSISIHEGDKRGESKAREKTYLQGEKMKAPTLREKVKQRMKEKREQNQNIKGSLTHTMIQGSKIEDENQFNGQKSCKHIKNKHV